ncbi:MAG: hypothetical protein HY903_17870 [Deltaproteobacteria bacterium]|nr:hypothetical protein [Deltaproteobacteria bacterium]
MPRQKKRPPPAPGTFRPAAPRDAHDIVSMYAIAARATCERPEALDAIVQTLGRTSTHLMPPEQMAANECARLWQFFVQAATTGKPTLRLEAGRALVRDLDMLGQRLDLAPLSGWDKIPAAIDDPNAVDPEDADDDDDPDSGDPLATVRRRAKKLATKKRRLSASDTLELLAALAPTGRQEVFGTMIGAGILGRSDATLVEQQLLRGGKLRGENDALSDTLDKLGAWLLGA